ncbi:MAG: exosortase/archaeosortase family protein [Verrucomicrobiales bacterium]|nr:exosortase/archaeosortase family protein [Verrucomicrobiales bacterium]
MKELQQLWASLPDRAAFVVTLIAWCLLFHVVGNTTFGYVNSPSMFGWLTGWYQLKSIGETGDELAPFIPLVVLGLLYLRREALAAVPKRPWTPALGLVFLGLAMHGLGFLGQQVRISVVGFIVGSWGLMGLYWGPAWLRATAFPWFVLLFAIPLAAYTDGITFHLRLLSTRVSVGLCNALLGLNLERSGTAVFHLPSQGGPGFRFDVAAACSGMRSASVVFLLSLLYAFLNFRTLWRRALLIAASIPLALAGNIVRLMVVFIVGEAMGEDAGKLIETKFGFLTYFGALAGLFGLGWLLREPGDGAGRPPGAACSSEATPSESPRNSQSTVPDAL